MSVLLRRSFLRADQTLSSLSSIQDYTSLGRQFSAVFVRTNTDDMLDKDDSLSSSNSRTSSGSSTSVLVLAANQHHQAAMRSDAMRRGRDKEREEKRLKALKIESNPPKDDDEKDRLSEKAKDRKHRRRPSAGSSVEKVSSAAEAEVCSRVISHLFNVRVGSVTRRVDTFLDTSLFVCIYLGIVCCGPMVSLCCDPVVNSMSLTVGR